MPLVVIVPPPSELISPSEIADVVVIALTEVVINVARATGFVLNATSFP
jgi:hypothetical protein